jgi:hypothetical protein
MMMTLWEMKAEKFAFGLIDGGRRRGEEEERKEKGKKGAELECGKFNMEKCDFGRYIIAAAVWLITRRW